MTQVPDCRSQSGVTARVTAAPLPLLVYGTLRLGEDNAPLLYGRARYAETILLEGYVLLDTGLGYPVAVSSEDDSGGPFVVCDVVELCPGTAREVLRDLDRLEGYIEGNPASLYARQSVEYTRPDGLPRQAWLYVPTPSTLSRLGSLPEVARGDWTAREDPSSAREARVAEPSPYGRMSPCR